MRLAALLAELPAEELDRLGSEHLGHEETISRATLCTTLEGVLRSYSFVRDFVINRQPPTFSILEALLEGEAYSADLVGFRELAMARTEVLSERVKSGEVVGRNESLRLYRRVLAEARRNDLELDPSETAILGVLRRELGIRHVEHFLIEHHPDLHEFWHNDAAFLDEMNALRTAGLVFAHEGRLFLAEEVVPLVRQALGLEMPRAHVRRIFEHLSGADLNEVLGHVELRASGTKEEKIERLLANYIQASEVLSALPLTVLRDLCRVVDAHVSGSKEELVERLVDFFRAGMDQRPTTDAPPPPVPEKRELDEKRFRALFWCLKSDELTDVLVSINSPRITGTKETKVGVVYQSPFSELTLLSGLTNRCVEAVLARNRLKTSGSKRERIDRILDFFTTMPEALLATFEGAAEPMPPQQVRGD